jgi:hypothetical protein
MVFHARLDSGTMTSLAAGYTADGGGTLTTCTTAQTIVTTAWTTFTCSFITPATHSGTPFIYFQQTGDNTSQTYYLDAIQLFQGYPAYNYQDSRITLNGTIASPITLQGANNSVSAFQVLNTNGGALLAVDTTNNGVTIKSPVNSAGAFQVLDSSGNPYIYVDTASDHVGIGVNSNLSASLTLGDPTGGQTTFRLQQGNTATTAGILIADSNGLQVAAASATLLLDAGSTGASNYGKIAINDSTGITATGPAKFVSPTGNSTTAFQIQQTASGTVLFNADTTNLIIKVAGNTTTFATLLIDNAHFKSTQTTAPTIGTPTNCGGGTGPTASITAGSTDSAGSFTINTGTTGSPTSCDTVITFNKAYGAAPKAILVTGQDAGSVTKELYVSSPTTTTFTVKMAVSPTNGNPYSWYYWVVE